MEEKFIPSSVGGNTEQYGEQYASVKDFFEDGMEPINFPETLTEQNYQEVFGGTLPEGLSPEIFEQGGSLRILE